MNFTEAARLKRFIQKNFSVNLHIHDTCGGLYLSIDEPNPPVKEFILAYCRANGISVRVSSDGRFFFPDAKAGMNDPEEDVQQDQNFEFVKDLDVVYVAAAKRAIAYVNKKQVGYCSYYESDGTWIIDHTVVEELYRNRGIAGQLVQCIVNEAGKRGMKVEAECSYAVKWFEEHPGIVR